MLNCPRCEGKLAEKQIEDVRIDTCGECGGIFLDENEFQKIKSSGTYNNPTISIGGGRKIDAQKPVKCVRCSTVMETVNFSYTSGIFIDYCPACHSTWFDGGELEKIIEFLKSSESANEDDSKKYGQILQSVKAEAEKKSRHDFRAISSSGKMGSVVNFIYGLVNKIAD